MLGRYSLLISYILIGLLDENSSPDPLRWWFGRANSDGVLQK